MSNDIVLTRLGHACVRLEKNGRRLVIDPGNFSDIPSALEGVDHILVTHEHADHLDDGPVLEYLGAHPEVTLRAPGSLAASLLDAAPSAGVQTAQIIAAGVGIEFSLAGFTVRTVGGQHALIHPDIPVLANTGYIVDDLIYHPGDSFIVPAGRVPDTLLLPIHGPWSKLSEVVDFVTAVRPRQAIPVHDGLLSEVGQRFYRQNVGVFAERHGVQLTVLQNNESLVIG